MYRRPLYGLALVVLARAPPALAVPVLVDFGMPDSPVASGYTAVSTAFPADYIHVYDAPGIDLGGGIKGGWNAYMNGNPFDTGEADPLLRDFVYWYGGVSSTFEVDGLSAGTYNLKVYGAYSGSVLGVGADGGVPEGVASFVVDNQSLGQTTGTAPVTVSSAGVLTITFGGIGTNNGMANGFELTAVPEPATLMLVALGAGLAARRRR